MSVGEKGQRGFKRMASFVGMRPQLRIRWTHQRTEIYRQIASTDEHPDAKTVYRRVRRRIPAISFDTVYRTLKLFEKKGIIVRVAHQGESVRYDANMTRHHHFVCARCGRIRDFRSEVLDRLPIPKSVAAFGRVESAQVQVRGICLACGAARSKASEVHSRHRPA
jgi:Fur family peroxide stress response transcriptional regulator